MAFIWQISILQFNEKTFVSGVILKGKFRRQKENISSNFLRIIGSYLKKPFRNKQIIISCGTTEYYSETNDHGAFRLEINHQNPNEIAVFDSEKSEPIPISQHYPKTFPDSEFPLAVISDIDDTLLVSHTASNLKRIRTILFTSPLKRKSVSFTREILESVWNKGGRVFYISKSESNLFRLLTSAIQKHKLPAGSLSLTPFLRYFQLPNPKKRKDFKVWSIKNILDNSPDKKFILIGDDTQQDVGVYTKIAHLYPDKILKIYIRKTLKNLTGNKMKQMNKLSALTVSSLYFNNKTDPKEEIIFIQNHQEL